MSRRNSSASYETASDVSFSQKVQNSKLRLEYRELFDDVRHRGVEDTDVLKESFQKADDLFQEVTAPREAVFDSHIVKLQSRIINQRTQALHTNLLTFVPTEFANKLRYFKEKRKSNPNKKAAHLDLWKYLGEQSSTIIISTPVNQILYGTFEAGKVEVKRKPRKPRAKDESYNAVQKPISVDISQRKDTNETTKEAARIQAILEKLYNRQGGPLCYFEFVINPNSFSETIENMFYVSILLKEGTVCIFLDEDDLPVIEPIRNAEKIQEYKTRGKCIQNIFSFSVQEWKDVVTDFQLQSKKPLIPSRGRVVGS